MANLLHCLLTLVGVLPLCVGLQFISHYTLINLKLLHPSLRGCCCLCPHGWRIWTCVWGGPGGYCGVVEAFN